jgi:O-antigen ligase
VLYLLILFLGLIQLTLGLLQYFFLPDMRFLHILGWDDHFYRLLGTQFDPNFMGAIFVVFFIMVEKLLSRRPRLKIIVQASFVLGVALTFSRSSYLAFGVASLILVFIELFRSKTRAAFKWLFMILLLGILIVVAPKPAGEGVKLARTSSVVSRLNRSESALKMMSSTDVIIGKGLFVPLNDVYPLLENQEIPNHSAFTDNLLLNYFVGMGAVGTVLTIVLLGHYAHRSMQNPLLIAFLFGISTHSLFNNTLLQPFVWLSTGLAVGVLLTKLEPKLDS